MNQATLPVRVAALYKFASFADISAIRTDLAALCNKLAIKGTILLAKEGINGTIAGAPGAIAEVIEHIRTLPGCTDLDVKLSSAEKMPFYRMKLRLKREIVTMGQPDINPLESVGHYVTAEQWNGLISDPDTIVIDTRNAYEVVVGSFVGAVNPQTKTFRDFPAWFRAEREHMIAKGTQPKIAMFCTGGIRCEKSTAFLKSEGLENVFHLQGGILKYLEMMPAEQSLWQGECFVFDNRVTISHGLEAGTYGQCHACRYPLSAVDCASPLYEAGISCPHCHAERSDTQRDGYRERHQQEKRASKRGESHVGAVLGANAKR